MKYSFPILIISVMVLTSCNGTQPDTLALETPVPPTETVVPRISEEPSATVGNRGGTWVRTFEGQDYGAFFDIIFTEDGSLLTVGTTNHLHNPPYSGDAVLMKLTLDGGVVWEKVWGGEGYEQAWAAALAEDKGFFIFGETDSYGAGNRDFFLLKTDEDGNEEWYRTYGRSHREWPYGMLVLSNGDLLIYGFSESEDGIWREQYAVRVGQNGDVIWEYIGDAQNDELVADAVEIEDGSIILAVIVEEDAKLVKLDADGGVLWEIRYELPGWQFASQISRTDDNDFLLAGFWMSSSPRQVDTWLVRCTSTGEMKWEKTFGDETFDDYAQSLIRLEDGTYLIGGLGNGMLLSRVDGDGNILWQRSLIGEAVYGAKALLEIGNDGYLVAGLIQIINGFSYDAIVLRTDAEGQIED